MAEPLTVTEQEFRIVMAQFATGVTVVTTALEGQLHGLTANAVTSVSLHPCLVLVCIDHDANSYRLISESGIFAVNILSWQQQILADRFAGRAPLVNASFDGVTYRAGSTGAPILEDALAWVECHLTQRVTAGDHDIFVGTAVAAGAAVGEAQEPLLFYRSRYARLQSR